MNMNYKQLFTVGLFSLLLTNSVMAADMQEVLRSEMRETAQQMIEDENVIIEDDINFSSMYDGAVWSSKASIFPASYDLRYEGYVPEIRSQGKWGTCWGFASMAASEISILSKLGLTASEFSNKYGKEMDLSEKHLAWFGTSYIADGEDQAGEGIHLKDEELEGQASHYNNGGSMGYASTLFSAGEGPVWESLIPYQAADGSDSIDGDWTLTEDERFMLSYELENSVLLPSPSERDENGEYRYNKNGTEAIKQELLAGRAVSIGYHFSLAFDFDAYKYDETSDTEVVEATEIVDETDSMEEPLDARTAAEELGIDYDAYISLIDRRTSVYGTTFIKTGTYAQYTDDKDAPADHGACIVGWDDNYDVSNFPADHQPPANGAWIVRNSMGTKYGNDGYFYLSYYDQTITLPETFEYIVNEDNRRLSVIDIHAYDMMPAVSVNSEKLSEPTYLANIYSIDDTEVLSAVSVMTAAKDSCVTVCVYLLNENAGSPVDGVMLDTVTNSYEFGGYHRIDLHQNYLIPAGAKISVVQLQRTTTTDGVCYAVPYTMATNQLLTETYNRLAPDPDYEKHCWFEGVIGKGESFIMLDDEWIDWSDLIASLYEEEGAAKYVTYDNLSMKAYLYLSDDLNTVHNFGEIIPYGGTEAKICVDCGFTIVYE